MDRCFPPVYRCLAVLSGLLLGGLTCYVRAQAPAARVMVADVLVTGSKFVQAQQVTSQLKTRAGMPYNAEVVNEDVRTLEAMKQFASVKADLQVQPDSNVKVVFVVQDWSNLVRKIDYLNANHINKDELNQLTGLREGAPLNPIANRLACQTIVNRYNEDGRAFASCQLLNGDKPGDTHVVFNITEGPVVKVHDVKFRGNTFASGPVLLTYINTSRKTLLVFGQTYNAAMVESDVNKLETYYKDFGYHDVRVARRLEFTPDMREVTITFDIAEGTRYKVLKSPEVNGIKSLPPELLEAMIDLKPGGYYNGPIIEKDLKRIKDRMGREGREVKAQAAVFYPKDQPGVCTVRYEVEESPPARAGEFIIYGNTRTRFNVILNQVENIRPGQILSYPDLSEAERNLMRLGIFKSATVTVLDPEGPNPFKTIAINVEEADTGTVNFGVGVTSDAGLTGTVAVHERNFDITRFPTSIDDLLSGNAFRGAGQEFRAEAMPGTQVQRYSISWRDPFIFDTPYGFGLSAYYFDRVYNEYDESRVGGRATLTRKLNQYWGASLALRVENVAVHNVFVGAPQDFQSVVGNNLLVGTRAGLVRDTRDSIFRPTQGSLVEFSYEQCFGDHIFPLVDASASKYFTVYQREDQKGRHVVALRTEVAWAGSNTPVYERYYAGGERSIRGFQFRGVGPDVNGFKTGGDFLWLNSVEYQVPIKANDSFYFVFFVDSGTVESRIDQLHNYRASAGFGMRIKLPMFGEVPLALDFGFPFLKGPGDNEQVFGFNMGWNPR
jgi:outer membrane protein assembly complex protein YaeT